MKDGWELGLRSGAVMEGSVKGMVRNSPGLDQGTHITGEKPWAITERAWFYLGIYWFSLYLLRLLKKRRLFSGNLDFCQTVRFLLTLSLPSFIMIPKAWMSCSLEGCLHITGIRNKPVGRILLSEAKSKSIILHRSDWNKALFTKAASEKWRQLRHHCSHYQQMCYSVD